MGTAAAGLNAFNYNIPWTQRTPYERQLSSGFQQAARGQNQGGSGSTDWTPGLGAVNSAASWLNNAIGAINSGLSRGSQQQDSGWPGGGYGYGGGGGINTGALISNTEKLAKDAAKGLDESLKSQLDTSRKMDEQNRLLSASQKQEQALEADEKFFANQQHLQSVFSQLRNKSGNAMQGSGLSDLTMLAKRYDDMSDAANLSALRQGNQNIEDNLFSQLSQNWQARANTLTEFLDKYRQLGQNLAADVSNIDANKGADYFSGDNMNWTGSKLNWLNNYMNDIREQQKTNTVPLLQQVGYFRPDGANMTQSGGSAQNTMGNINPQYWQALAGYDNRNAKGD